MKIAFLFCGETRTWDSTNVEKNQYIPHNYSTVSDVWQNTVEYIDNSLTDFNLDLYGITWKHCSPIKNREFFKSIKLVDFYGNRFRSELQYETARIISNNKRLDDKDYPWNTIAQYYQWIEGLKFVYKNYDYDFVVKMRWDIIPQHPQHILNILNDLNNYQGTDPDLCVLAAQDLRITNGVTEFMDIIFGVNKALYEKRFKKNTTEEILYRHVLSEPPEGLGNISLFIDDSISNSKIHSLFDTNCIHRILHKGFKYFEDLDDQVKNYGITKRPPT